MISGPKKYNKNNFHKQQFKHIKNNKDKNQWIKSVGNYQRITENVKNPIKVFKRNKEIIIEKGVEIEVNASYINNKDKENEKRIQILKSHPSFVSGGEYGNNTMILRFQGTNIDIEQLACISKSLELRHCILIIGNWPKMY